MRKSVKKNLLYNIEKSESYILNKTSASNQYRPPAPILANQTCILQLKSDLLVYKKYIYSGEIGKRGENGLIVRYLHTGVPYFVMRLRLQSILRP